MVTQAGDAGEEKRLLDIAQTGKMAAGPGQTGGKKTLIRQQQSVGAEIPFHGKGIAILKRLPKIIQCREESCVHQSQMALVLRGLQKACL